jgi:hypothetical protein
MAALPGKISWKFRTTGCVPLFSPTIGPRRIFGQQMVYRDGYRYCIDVYLHSKLGKPGDRAQLVKQAMLVQSNRHDPTHLDIQIINRTWQDSAWPS